MKTAGRYHSLAVNWPKFYPLAVKAMARLRPSCNRFRCSSDAMQPTLTNTSTYVFYIYLSAENMYKIKSKIVENSNSKETAWGLTNWFEFGFDRFECFTPKASLQNRRNFLVFFRGTEASGKRTRCTSHDQGEECKPTSPHAWLALHARLALASVVLKNAKKVTPVWQADHRLKNEL